MARVIRRESDGSIFLSPNFTLAQLCQSSPPTPGVTQNLFRLAEALEVVLKERMVTETFGYLTPAQAADRYLPEDTPHLWGGAVTFKTTPALSQDDIGFFDALLPDATLSITHAGAQITLKTLEN